MYKSDIKQTIQQKKRGTTEEERNRGLSVKETVIDYKSVNRTRLYRTRLYFLV